MLWHILRNESLHDLLRAGRVEHEIHVVVSLLRLDLCPAAHLLLKFGHRSVKLVGRGIADMARNLASAVPGHGE